MRLVLVKLDLDRLPPAAIIRKITCKASIASMSVAVAFVKLNESISLYTDKLNTLGLLVNKEYEVDETKIIKKYLKQGIVGLVKLKTSFLPYDIAGKISMDTHIIYTAISNV